MYCLTCDYPLTQLAHHECPECGRPFDPAEARTYRARPRRWWNCRSVATGTGAGAALLGFAAWHVLQVIYIEWYLEASPRMLEALLGGAIRDGSWWELEGPGLWLWPLQHGVFAAWSAIAGWLVGRRVLHGPRSPA